LLAYAAVGYHLLVDFGSIGIGFAYFVEDRMKNTQRTKRESGSKEKNHSLGTQRRLSGAILFICENGKEMDFRTRNGLANNFSSGKETLSSEAPMV
jgi:hypothetical protein